MSLDNRVLFILKRRGEGFVPDDNIHTNAPGLSTGLHNSSTFVKDMMNDMGIVSEISVVVDNNGIDKEVTLFKPTHVVIEALWVTPTKFSVLCKLHPEVKWIIRLHSEMPFLAGEGMAIDWLGDYMSFENVSIAINAPRLLDDIRLYIKLAKGWSDEVCESRVFYLPNFYPQDYIKKEFDKDKDHVDVCCFGAIRPLKNHMIQAMAALKFADHIGKKLNFHINSGRQEMKGQPVYNNLIYLFLHLSDSGHKLVDHVWTPREEFLILCNKMDIGMQVSFSETFNIVGADLISQGVPLIATSEIPWAIKEECVDPTSTDAVFNQLLNIYNSSQNSVDLHQESLTNYTNTTKEIWYKKFK